MEPFVTMRTKLVRTVDKSVIANMIVLSNETSQPTSSVGYAATLVIWPEIARTDSVVLTGVMVLHLQEECLVDLDLQRAELVLVMLLIARWR